MARHQENSDETENDVESTIKEIRGVDNGAAPNAFLSRKKK
jgi:hypothetical protein